METVLRCYCFILLLFCVRVLPEITENK